MVASSNAVHGQRWDSLQSCFDMTLTVEIEIYLIISH